MKKTRIASLILVLLLCLGSLACAQAADGETPDEYRITLFVESANVATSDETVIGQIIKDKFNIAFDFEVMVGDWNEFINMKLAAQDFPELAYLRWDYVGPNWVNGGGAIPLDDLFADKENFQTLHKDRLPLWRMDDPSGNDTLYKWTIEGGLSEEMGPRNDLLVRADVLEHFGYPKLLSQSDWVEFLKKAVAEFPTDLNGNPTIGLCVPLAEAWGPTMANIFYEKGTYTGAIGLPALFNMETGRYEDYLSAPAVKENYQFFNELYREGLLDSEVFTTTVDPIKEKMNSAQPIAVFYSTFLSGEVNRNLANNGHEEMSYISMPIQSDSQVANGETRYLATWQGYGTYAYTMTPATRHPERIAELIDWACSPEGLSLLTWGVEGTHWNWVDGVKTPTPEFLDMYLEAGDEYYHQGVGLFNFLGVPNGYSPYDGAAVQFGYAPIFTEMTYSDTIKKTLAAYGFTREEQFWTSGDYVKSGTGNITVEQSAVVFPPESEEARVNEQILQTRNNYIADLIRAGSEEEFERVWSAFAEAHQALNPEKCVDYVNARQAELMARYLADD